MNLKIVFEKMNKKNEQTNENLWSFDFESSNLNWDKCEFLSETLNSYFQFVTPYFEMSFFVSNISWSNDVIYIRCWLNDAQHKKLFLNVFQSAI